MPTKLKLVFLLILLPSFESQGQINELSLLGIDPDDFMQSSNPVSDGLYRESEKPKEEINREAQSEAEREAQREKREKKKEGYRDKS